MNFRVPPTPRCPLAFHHQSFVFRGHRFPRWFHPTFLLRKVSARPSSYSAASSTGGGGSGGGREGNFLLIPGATMATLLMFGFLHARRMYDDRKVQDMRQRGIEPEFSPDAKAAFLRLLPLRSISRLWGNLMSVEIPAWSRPFIYKAWARAFHCDLDEASLPLEKYASLQDFFVRSLKEGTRPIDPDPKSMVTGHLYPTNERAVRTIRNLHIENERVVLEGQWNEGFLAIAAVGATNVGSIKLFIEPELRTNRPTTKLFPSGSPDERVYDPPGVGLTVKKGEEIAAFNMGSTVVLVFQAPVSELSESNCISDFKFSVGAGDRIRVGEAIGRWGNS